MGGLKRRGGVTGGPDIVVTELRDGNMPGEETGANGSDIWSPLRVEWGVRKGPGEDATARAGFRGFPTGVVGLRAGDAVSGPSTSPFLSDEVSCSFRGSVRDRVRPSLLLDREVVEDKSCSSTMSHSVVRRPASSVSDGSGEEFI